MANSKVSRQEVLRGALELFRSFGFKGVSLNDISQKTGLEKPSLYFKFPRGKKEIALEALRAAIDFFSEQVIKPLSADGTAEDRLQTAIQGLRIFYANGTMPCVTNSFSFAIECPEVAEALDQFLRGWIDAFGKVVEESGSVGAAARERAEKVIVAVEGSLILSRVFQDPRAFRKTLLEIPEMLLKSS
jgi:AcrR family transcriptional regulator